MALGLLHLCYLPNRHFRVRPMCPVEQLARAEHLLRVVQSPGQLVHAILRSSVRSSYYST